MSTQPAASKAARTPRAPRAKPHDEQAPSPQPADHTHQPSAVAAEVVLAMLWHYRHEAGNTLACVVTEREITEMKASFDYTKQDAAVAVVNKHGRMIVSVVERNTRMLDPKTGALISAGNEVRPCESTADGGEQARRAAERAGLNQQAQEMAQRLLGEERSGTFSGESMREAARLLTALAEVVR